MQLETRVFCASWEFSKRDSTKGMNLHGEENMERKVSSENVWNTLKTCSGRAVLLFQTTRLMICVQLECTLWTGDFRQNGGSYPLLQLHFEI